MKFARSAPASETTEQAGLALRQESANRASVATTAGPLPARWVIHTVGPVWSATEDHSAVRGTRTGSAGHARKIEASQLRESTSR
ncbi:macro domain-containing protein [Nocardia salmonicida]|uniref:macro domain-containing protein n=1 Tax=Nocardia salmonicida TaxID=53431 RepID=UPI003F53EF13